MGRIREAVLAHANEIKDLLPVHHACSIRVFGSVARAEDGPHSDADFLVEFEPGANILDQIHLEQELVTLLGCAVDVVPLGGLTSRDAHLVAEAITL